MDNQYCMKCGTQMNWHLVENRQREVCPACGWIHYQHLKVAVAAQIELFGRLLLLQRAEEPWKDYWNLPAGYVEVDEPLEMAVVREAREETGLDVIAVHLVGDYYFDDDPRGNGLLLVFSAEILTGRVRTNKESRKAKYFSPDSLPDKICGAGHRRAVEMWKLKKLSA
ncbi:MAG: NUDIX hydrolase [Anaerolineales bacterium]|nr:NUDIX hydrolase [Anaerolineales bacterium]